MKKLFTSVCLAIVLLFTFVSVSSSSTFTFNDTVNYWNGWGNNTDDDNHDVIGVPNLTGGYGTVNNGYINEININWIAGGHPSMEIGDLFIDIGSDGTWDHVLTHDGLVYNFEFALDASQYYHLTDQGNWAGNIREGHPYEFNSDGILNDGYVDVYGNITQPEGTVTFTNFGVWVGWENFTIGFGPNCANDMLYENVHQPVPEPATIFLLGTAFCISGVGVLRKKYKTTK